MRLILCALTALIAAACATADERPLTDMSVPPVYPARETVAVESGDDAADDPAIFVDPFDPSRSLILGTDKKAGLHVYDLAGQVRQVLPTGRLNNVDLRQDRDQALVVATNRSDDSVAVFAIEGGQVRQTGSFPAIRTEPYGVCLGIAGDGTALVAVTHRGGQIDLYGFASLDASDARHLQTTELGEQLEGCVFDEPNGRFFVGKEESGINRYALTRAGLLVPGARLVDTIGGSTGIVADVEGLSIYRGRNAAQGYLIASSQGNNTYALYSRDGERFIGRFRVSASIDGSIDGAEHTDGLDVTSALLPGYPEGLLVVQDGFNDPGENQNFKLISWADIAATFVQP